MASGTLNASRANWTRFKNFTRTLLRSRMAALGLVIIVIFTALALAAPLLTPYDPRNDIVAGPLSPPAWASFLPLYQDRSDNIAFPGIDVQTVPTSGSNFNIVSDDEAEVSFSRQASSGPFNAVISKTLDYPFNGPPARFRGELGLVPFGVSVTSPASFKVYVEKVGDRPWVLWRGDLTVSGAQVFPNVPLDSNEVRLIEQLNLTATALNPAEIIFDGRGSFRFVVEVTFPASTVPASVTVKNMRMRLLGTVFGLLGTDDGGRDLFSQLVYGARVSLLVGLAVAGIGVTIGLVVGLVSGFLGGAVDEVLMRFNDMILVIPTLPLLIVLLAVLSPSINNIVLILGLLGWNGFARVVRSQVLSLRERPFIEAARASGAGTTHIVARHIIPNIMALIYVSIALSVPGAILAEAGLSFLGLYDPTVSSWGRTINESLTAGTSLGGLWWWILPPGFSIAILSLAFILVGYGLDEIFNPKLRMRR